MRLAARFSLSGGFGGDGYFGFGNDEEINTYSSFSISPLSSKIFIISEGVTTMGFLGRCFMLSVMKYAFLRGVLRVLLQ